MAFTLGVLSFILGSVLVAVCLIAIPGPDAMQEQGSQARGHDAH